MNAEKKLTLAGVKKLLSEVGISITKRDGEYRVFQRNAPEGHYTVKAALGYFTTDLADALGSGLCMAKARDEKLNQASTITEQRETFAEYLARVGRDQLESGRECTAEDYAKASARIEELESCLSILVGRIGPNPSGLVAKSFPHTLAVLDNRFQHLA